MQVALEVSAELPLFIAYLSSAVPRHDETR
jgi:hypothetical protein